MKYEYRGCKIFYKFLDRKSEITDVYLHGWGCDYSSLYFCNELTKNNCLFVDFPPFGQSSKGVDDWNVFTYANMVIALCKKLNLGKLNLIGHSFGGRIAIIISVLCKEDVNRLVLVDSAGAKPRRGVKYYIKIWSYKIRKRLHMDTSNYGSCDYRALTPNMRKVFNSIVNTHLDEFLPYIKCNTLIIFGSQDKTTPLYMARRFHKKIAKSQLLILENAGHFSFIDRKLEFSKELKKFLT